MVTTTLQAAGQPTVTADEIAHLIYYITKAGSRARSANGWTITEKSDGMGRWGDGGDEGDGGMGGGGMGGWGGWGDGGMGEWGNGGMVGVGVGIFGDARIFFCTPKVEIFFF